MFFEKEKQIAEHLQNVGIFASKKSSKLSQIYFLLPVMCFCFHLSTHPRSIHQPPARPVARVVGSHFKHPREARQHRWRPGRFEGAPLAPRDPGSPVEGCEPRSSQVLSWEFQFLSRIKDVGPEDPWAPLAGFEVLQKTLLASGNFSSFSSTCLFFFLIIA